MSETVTAPADGGAPSARLRLLLPEGPVRALVLVLPGGRVKSMQPTRWWHLSSLRMRPFTARLASAGKSGGIAVAQLQYGVRGWNGSTRSPVADARWALHYVRDRFSAVPVALLGHSMGGRTAAAVAGETEVARIAAFAPWWQDDEVAAFQLGQRLLVAHGTDDTWTSPRTSRAAAAGARGRGIEAQWMEMDGGHFMLRHPKRWHQLAVNLLLPGLPRG